MTPAKNRLLTEAPDAMPYMINGILGGMITPSSAEEAMVPAAKLRSYLCLSISGTMIAPTAAAVAALEPEIAALAAQKATEQDKEEIVRLCDEVENFYRAGKNHTKKDQAFHAAIAKASGNSVVESLMPTIHTAIITFVNLTYHKLMEETIQTHRAVTEAIVQGDSVGAKCAMIMHLTYNRQMLVKMMQERKAGNKTDDNKE